ncbi:redoxin domain-containing protein [Sphingopyxis sp. BSNA05]|uniref:redoxin domain-containing protein n=1 Tax=Sphingopyxis sp. BSNA05 TaxID=1236614 RepID=UPI00349F4417
MKKWIVILLAVAIIGGGAFVYNTRSANAEPLEIGVTAPDFTTTGALAGEEFQFSLSEKLKDGPVVLYFFPKVFTEGCTIEANMFAEATAEFNAAGATVIGMSGDDIEGLKNSPSPNAATSLRLPAPMTRSSTAIRSAWHRGSQ